MSSDYVIVGAGLTGLALGVRLAEDPSINVTILEAGSSEQIHDENIDTPGFISFNLRTPERNWMLFSTPQKHLGGRPLFLPRGKGIGGSSLINFLQYSRAPKIEYDDIEKKLGAQGWAWDELLPYFKKACSCVLIEAAMIMICFIKSENLKYNEEYAAEYGYKLNPEYHGTSGPLQTRIPQHFSPAAVPWIESIKQLGIKHNPDPVSGDTTGAWITLQSVDDKSIRSSSASAYYEPNQSRPNLKIITGAFATRVLTSGSDEVIATGVEYLKDGVKHTIHATKEVILSAGAYKTPQILELSGFGDPEVLKKFGIDVVVDLPGVGNNLQVKDHFMTTLTMKLKAGTGLDTCEKLSDPAFVAKQLEQFKVDGKGFLAAGPPTAYALLTLKDFDNDGKIAELAKELNTPDTPFFRLQKEWVNNDRIPILELSGYDRFIPGALAAPEPDVDYFSSSAIPLHPFNVGSVHITSTDPNAAPAIDHNYLDNEVDIKILVESFRIMRKIFSTAPLKDLVEVEVSPGPNVQTDEDITEYIKKFLATTFHPLGTASLLPRKDGGVVDTEFKVYGTKNLRVVDASVIPIQLGAHPQATLYAHAEKLAEFLKGGDLK